MNDQVKLERLEFAPRTDGPAGLGGWLILPIIGLFLTIAIVGFTGFSEVIPVFFNSTWTLLTTPGNPGYHAMWAPYFVVSAISLVVMLSGAIACLVLMFKKHKRLPLLMTAFYLFSLVFASVDFWAVSTFLPEVSPTEASAAAPDIIKALARAVVTCLIWIPYFATSKRVKNTFVH